jgi:hypothetical protein
MTYDPNLDWCGSTLFEGTPHEFYFDWPDGWWSYTCYLHDVGEIGDWGIFLNMMTDPLTALIGFVMAVGLRLAYVIGLRKGRKR